MRLPTVVLFLHGSVMNYLLITNYGNCELSINNQNHKETRKISQLSYNLGDNILELYNVLIQTRLTTSKMKRDI